MNPESHHTSTENDGVSVCGSARRRPRIVSNVARSRFGYLALEVILAFQYASALSTRQREQATTCRAAKLTQVEGFPAGQMNEATPRTRSCITARAIQLVAR